MWPHFKGNDRHQSQFAGRGGSIPVATPCVALCKRGVAPGISLLKNMSNETAVATTDKEKPMEYVPFGSQDKIKLTVAIVQNLICVKTKTGKVCSPQDAI